MAKGKKKKAEPKPKKTIELPDQFNIIAADLSLDCPGFCLWRQRSETDVTIETFHIDNSKIGSKEEHGKKLENTFENLGRLRDFEINNDDAPTFWVREHAFLTPGRGQNQGGIFECVGMTNWWLYCHNEKTWEEIFPVSIKKHVTGDGKADKKKVETCLETYVGKRTYGTDDESDAVAVAVCFLIMNGKMKHMFGGEEND